MYLAAGDGKNNSEQKESLDMTPIPQIDTIKDPYLGRFLQSWLLILKLSNLSGDTFSFEIIFPLFRK